MRNSPEHRIISKSVSIRETAMDGFRLAAVYEIHPPIELSESVCDGITFINGVKPALSEFEHLTSNDESSYYGFSIKPSNDTRQSSIDNPLKQEEARVINAEKGVHWNLASFLKQVNAHHTESMANGLLGGAFRVTHVLE